MRVVDLFCGCGGLSLGFEKEGYNVVAAYDNWDAAIEVYKSNFNHPVYKFDLMDVERATESVKFHHPEMIIGGPPCQDFSPAGKRDENNGRGDLTVSYAKIVAAVRPEWFVMENVERITKTQKLLDAVDVLKKAGYGLTQIVLDASLCGVPQKRKRFILVGKIGAADGFILNVLKEHLASKPMTVADALGDKLDIKFYYRHPRSYARRGIFSVDEPSPTIRGVNRPIPAGYTPHPTDPIKDLTGIRALTSVERSMIQTFPKNFKFIGTKTSIEQMIGNAVPVNLGAYVGRCIKLFIQES